MYYFMEVDSQRKNMFLADLCQKMFGRPRCMGYCTDRVYPAISLITSTSYARLGVSITPLCHWEIYFSPYTHSHLFIRFFISKFINSGGQTVVTFLFTTKLPTIVYFHVYFCQRCRELLITVRLSYYFIQSFLHFYITLK